MASPGGKKLTDCPSNLKEAIDWILRVTGKDGQVGGTGDGTTALSEQVKKLLEEVKSADPKLSAEIKKVTEALNGSGAGLIAKLADGLQQFIGYQSGSNPHGHITGAGIAPSNIATHRLCDATIAFTIGVLEGCKKYSDLTNTINSQYLQKVEKVINDLYSIYGIGPGELKNRAQQISSDLKTVEKSNVGGFVKNMGTAFHKFTRVSNTADDAASKVGEYLKEVFSGWGQASAERASGQLTALANNFKSGKAYDPFKDQANYRDEITQLNTDIKTEVGGNINYLTPILTAGKSAFISHLRNMNYMPTHYNATSLINWTSNTNQVQTCAKIFLATIPLIFSKLSYFYWRCHNNGGGWHQMQLNGRDTHGGHLGNYLFGMDYHPRFLNGGKKGHNIVQTAMTTKHFKDFEEGMTKAQGTASTRASREKKKKQELYSDSSESPNTKPTYLEFLVGCNEKLNDNMKSGSASKFDECPLSALHMLASCYFRCMQSKISATSSRPPSTIREMLYFLAALPYSPNYDSLKKHISNHFKSISSVSDDKDDAELMIAVADSSTTAKHNTLSAADLKYHLISTCSFSTAVLGMIQGPGASTGSDPWLYEMYCNSAFNLKYPSGSALFSALAKYSYAVQFQMNFLYWQCYNNGMRCGWQYCWFGSEIEPKKNSEAVTSHLCHADCESHNSGSGACVDHNTIGKTKCGKKSGQGSPSPLQSFLTDCLSGFCRKIPGASYHLTTCSGPCHAPMGFAAVHLRSVSKIGWNIMAALIPFCSSEKSPLTQLSEKLGCLTKRAPRTLGDLFGFKWHLNGQLFKSDQSEAEAVKEFFKSLGLTSYDKDSQITPVQFLKNVRNRITGLKSPTSSKVIEKALSLFPGLPFWSNLFMVKPDDSLPVRLFKVKSTDHRLGGPSNYKGSHNDLFGLYNPQCSGQSCGQYLRPLCFSNGTTYSPKHASSYLSWVLYLSDDLLASFGELLAEFNNIDCSTSNCKYFSTSQKCSKNHGPETHGSSDVDCKCDSVVECGGTLPILYSYGFNFHNAFVLMGGRKIGQAVTYDGATKRSCNKFHNTLTAVLKADAPLDKLIITIDTFLYAIRWEFFSKLSGFWTIYIGLILYTFFFLLDTLHLRSHLKLTSSHVVPPLALLTSGTPLPGTKLTYITQ
ncbi:uncharacterized protein BcabD6B2_24230 [Babesia caballi]|uniref:Uncharacterized protein n=1 Tax=Babesia caballi TaxID=5871 RepID=A0AAV4LT92_BABCB|nr:hypothetical protein, conserved [Babesia caballi]